ncbi:hypothetical protein J8J14_09050 [Roseomonas sp. SSH11]|uniref:Uncharacterized protein n=1 Tax=Pararoseomonas baculiformis TaxID=2820812 RepID=A0ABS4AD42_9PROT|nr:hypothetical protein [Pararoseomonas baculiformis]MBP0444930.1 hypothetical protein [Pararoseomonas baculiformis]
MIRLLILALPLSLLSWWALTRVGQPRDKAWLRGVAISFVALGGIVFFAEDGHEGGRVLAAALWAGIHALLFLILRPFLGRAR